MMNEEVMSKNARKSFTEQSLKNKYDIYKKKNKILTFSGPDPNFAVGRSVARSKFWEYSGMRFLKKVSTIYIFENSLARGLIVISQI